MAPVDPSLDAFALALTLGSEEMRDATFYKLLAPAVICKVLATRLAIFCFFAPLVRLFFGVSKVRKFR
jgi:hypothetical protein